MTISGHKKMSSPGQSTTYGTQYSTGTSVDQIKAFLRSVDFCSFFLQIQQNSLRLVKIVKAFNLRNIQLVQLFWQLSPPLPLMPGHMAGVDLFPGICLKFIKQMLHLVVP